MAADSITTVSDMFRSIEDEINDVKTGKLDDEKGRLVFHGRSLQIRLAALNLQWQRLQSVGDRQRKNEFQLVSPKTDGKTEAKRPD